VSSSMLQRISYLAKLIVDHGGRSFHGEEKAAAGPARLVKTRKATVGQAYSQDVFDQNASDVFVVTEGLVVSQEPSVYPGVDAIGRPLLGLFGQENSEPNLN